MLEPRENTPSKMRKERAEENEVLHMFCDTACIQCLIIHTGFLSDRHNCGELLF